MLRGKSRTDADRLNLFGSSGGAAGCPGQHLSDGGSGVFSEVGLFASHFVIQIGMNCFLS